MGRVRIFPDQGVGKEGSVVDLVLSHLPVVLHHVGPVLVFLHRVVGLVLVFLYNLLVVLNLAPHH